MKFDQIWQQLLNKDSRLSDDNAVVEFKAGNLKRLLRQVHEQGAKTVEASKPAPSVDPFGGFADIFRR